MRVMVTYYCGMFVGAPKWQRGQDWHYEPDECDTQGIAYVDLDDWKQGVAMVVCDGCKNKLSQADDHLSMIDGQFTNE